MTCALESCECAGKASGISLRMFCPHYQHPEHPPGDIERVNILNWQSLPEATRSAGLAHLRSVVPLEIIQHWRDQHARGMAIGSDDVRFHLGVGMQVRNTLRRATFYRKIPLDNWDDCYYGALVDLVAPRVAVLPKRWPASHVILATILILVCALWLGLVLGNAR